MNINRLIELMHDTELAAWIETIEKQVEQGLSNDTYGKLSTWQAALKALPKISSHEINLISAQVSVKTKQALSDEDLLLLKSTLKQFMPWRKGPYHIQGIDVDTEWRSDLKWQRLSSAIKPLQGKTVLDVGCGNGYHAWRMRGMGAELVIGIDPSPLFVMQFEVLQHFIHDFQWGYFIIGDPLLIIYIN